MLKINKSNNVFLHKDVVIVKGFGCPQLPGTGVKGFWVEQPGENCVMAIFPQCKDCPFSTTNTLDCTCCGEWTQQDEKTFKSIYDAVEILKQTKF